MIAEVVFIVLMIFWVCGGGFVSYEGTTFNGRRFAGYTLIPWFCVAILGYCVFTGVPVGAVPVR